MIKTHLKYFTCSLHFNEKKSIEKLLHEIGKLDGNFFRQLIKLEFVKRQPHRTKCQGREKSLTAVSGVF